MQKQDEDSPTIALASSSFPVSTPSSLASEVTVCTWGEGGVPGEEGCGEEGGSGSAASMAGWIIGPDTGKLKCEYDLVICCVTPPPPPLSLTENESGAPSMAHAVVCLVCFVRVRAHYAHIGLFCEHTGLCQGAVAPVGLSGLFCWADCERVRVVACAW